MPSWLIVAGNPAGNNRDVGETRYFCAVGSLSSTTLEVDAQYLIRDSYTLASLYVYVDRNRLTSATTWRSRVNGANGNQSVSIPAAATGAFEDNVNSDNLVSGNLVNSQIVVGATGTDIRTTLVSYALTSASQVPILGTFADAGMGDGRTKYAAPDGCYDWDGPEGCTQYVFRTTSTMSNLRCYVGSNTLDGASTFRTRRNGVNGNQSVGIGAGLTGGFEDAVNSDNVAIGDTFNYRMETGGTAGTLWTSVLQLKSSSQGRQTIASQDNSFNIPFATTGYWPCECSNNTSAPEAASQTKARTDLTLRNFCAIIWSNTLDGITTMRTRVNGGNGNLSVSIGAATTGTFEDTVNSDSVVAADLINTQFITGGTAGNMFPSAVGFEQQQPAAGGAMPYNVGKTVAAIGA